MTSHDRARYLAALLLIAGLAVMAMAQAALPSTPDVHLIRPGIGMGPVRLGMTPAQVAVAARLLGECTVRVAYRDGVAVRLETSWGGCLATAEGVQVGIPVDVAVAAWGPYAEEIPAGFFNGALSWPRRGVGVRAVGEGARTSGYAIVEVHIFPRSP
jgi:hypothetical protein